MFTNCKRESTVVNHISPTSSTDGNIEICVIKNHTFRQIVEERIPSLNWYSFTKLKKYSSQVLDLYFLELFAVLPDGLSQQLSSDVVVSKAKAIV